MLPPVLFIIYLVTGIWLIHRYAVKDIYPFSIVQTAGIVSFKVLLGCVYGYVFLHYYHGDDPWDIFYQSLGSYEKLTHYPGEFFHEFNPEHAWMMANHQTSDAPSYYYHHAENWVMVKSFALLNVISGRNYYVDALLFDLILMPGPLLIFRYVRAIYTGKPWLLMVAVFFIPTVTFWLSGIRAEGLLLLFTALLLGAAKGWSDKTNLKSLAAMLVCGLACVLFRIQYAILLLPALGAYLISLRNPIHAWRNFLIVYGSISLLFFISLWLPGQWQASLPIRHAQSVFFALHGNTRFALDTLQPGPVSFLRIIPQAGLNGILRPFPWEAKGWLQAAVALERTLLIVALIVLAVLGKFRFAFRRQPLLLFFFFFSVTLLLLEATVVPFPGALVRYAAVPEWLLLIAVLAGLYPPPQKPKFDTHNTNN